MPKTLYPVGGIRRLRGESLLLLNRSPRTCTGSSGYTSPAMEGSVLLPLGASPRATSPPLLTSYLPQQIQQALPAIVGSLYSSLPTGAPAACYSASCRNTLYRSFTIVTASGTCILQVAEPTRIWLLVMTHLSLGEFLQEFLSLPFCFYLCQHHHLGLQSYAHSHGI